MSAVLDGLILDDGQLQDVRRALVARIDEGFAADGREIKALPAWAVPPRAGLSGEALVLDAGGTNLRAALVAFEGGQGRVVRGPLEARLDVRDQAGTRAAFFGQHADLVNKLEPPAGLPVGYCFSYPSAVERSGDAKLLAWTKGIEVSGVVGTLVGAGLVEALADAGVPTSSVFVLNDTVAALLAGAPGAADPARTIGLIVGTGTNMAGFFEAARLPKVGGGQGVLAVNLESGNFHPPHLAALDDELDAADGAPGTQRFEKAVSGHYLPQLLARACPELGFDPTEGSGGVVRVAAGTGGAADVARALLDRSADLVAAALCAVGDRLPGEGPVRVQAEGGLYWKAPGYDERVRQVLARLEPARPVEVVAGEHANLIGAAAAALAR